MHNGQPLVTVISLVYNTGHYVIEALQSVRAQNYHNVQHILVDDCSRDNSLELVENWVRINNYPCEIIHHPRNLGVCRSLNDALKVAKGKYVTFVSDDLLLPNKFHQQIELFESLSEDYAVVYSDIWMRRDDGTELGTLFSCYRDFLQGPEGFVFEELFLGNFVHCSAAFIRMDCLRDVGYFNEGLLVEDVDLFLRIAKNYKFKFDYKITAIYRIHGASLLKTIGLRGLEDNLRSLEPHARYSSVTLSYFISFLDIANIRFHKENFPGWRNWFKKRVEYKTDVKSLFLFFVAVFNFPPAFMSSSTKLSELANKVKSKLKSIVFKDSVSTKYSIRSYSQCGEDLLIRYIFNLRGIGRPSYLDIGANNPFFLSNTAHFYENGSRGINIEANPNLIKKFKQFRPKDINLNVGIAAEAGELEFYIMEDDTLSTFSKGEMERLVKNEKKFDHVERIKLMTVEDILEEYYNGRFPDFLSLDVEGFDFDILKSIKLENHSPKVICVEAAEYSPIGAGARRDELIKFLEEKGYYEYANTNLNAVMVKRDFWFI